MTVSGPFLSVCSWLSSCVSCGSSGKINGGTSSDGGIEADGLALIGMSSEGVGMGAGMGDSGETGCHVMGGVPEEEGRLRRYWRCWEAARTFGTTDAGSNE